MPRPEKTAEQQVPRNVGRFKKGISGNPHGRPQGARNKTTLAAETLLDQEAEKLTRLAIDKALGGDTVCLRLCLDRILPPKRERALHLQLPTLVHAQDALGALQQVVTQVTDGTMNPDEGNKVSAMIQTWLKTLETLEFAQRLDALEEQLAKTRQRSVR